MEGISPQRSERKTSHADRTAFAMRALGRNGLPRALKLNDKTYLLAREVKHDFWAATGFYDSSSGERIVFKAGRAHSFAGLPLQVIGKWLRDRELRIYERLRGVPNIPRILGSVGQTGFVMEFLSGRQLGADKRVPDGFFARLREILDQVHRRDVAYVDMNKRANILIDERDGRPYLVDFQISFDGHELGGPDSWLGRRILSWLQREDIYHINKHHARLRPDELTPEQIDGARRRSVLIRLHRFIAKPYYGFRRRTLDRMRATGRVLPEGSE